MPRNHFEQEPRNNCEPSGNDNERSQQSSNERDFLVFRGRSDSQNHATEAAHKVVNSVA